MRTDPLVMNGMISSGRLVTHTPRRDMTLVCSSDNMVDTSFDSCTFFSSRSCQIRPVDQSRL
ncbi:hypothetical protein GBAR_LOCUS1947, partial [Geodia barretti]